MILRNNELYKLEVAEVRQKLQTTETLEKELKLLHLQREVASEQATANVNGKRQSFGGVWGWLTETPPPEHESIDYVPQKDNLKERVLFSISEPTTTIVFCKDDLR